MASKPTPLSPAPPPKPVKRVNSGKKKTPLLPVRSPPPIPTFNFERKPYLRRGTSADDSSSNPVAAPRATPRRSQCLVDDVAFLLRKLMSSVNRFQLDGKFCDVAIVYEDHQFPAHEIVLAAHSQYFEEIFLRPEYRAQERRELVVKGVDKQVMASCIGYMYTNMLNITMENVAQLLRASKLMKIDDITKLCWKYLGRNVRPETSLCIENLANENHNDNIAAMAVDCFQQKFEEASKSEDFKELPIDAVVNKLKSNDLEVSSEEVVYEAAIRWLKHHANQRKRFVPDILRCVRLSLLSGSYLAETVRNESLIKGYDQCRDMLEEAFASLLKPSTDQKKTQARKQPRSDEFKIFVLSTKDTALYTYSTVSDTWSSKMKSPIGNEERSLVVYGSEMFAVGGKGSSFMQKLGVAKESPTWQEVPNDIMLSLSGIGTAIVGDCMYLTGGKSWPLTHSSMYKYDILNNAWIAEPHMKMPRAHHVMVTAKGFLYCIGGSTGASVHDGAEKFDLTNGVWSDIPAMKLKRTGAAGITHDEEIYVLGGHDGSAALNSVEIYDTQTLSWTTTCAMQIPRCRFGACFVDQKIFVIGGSEESSMAFFDVEAKEWRERPIPTHIHVEQTSLALVSSNET